MLEIFINPVEEKESTAVFEMTDEAITKEKINELFRQAANKQEVENKAKNGVEKCDVSTFKFTNCNFQPDSFDEIVSALNSTKVTLIIFEKTNVTLPLLEKLTRASLNCQRTIKHHEIDATSYPIRINNLLQDWRNKWRLTASPKHDQNMQNLINEFNTLFSELLQFKLEFLMTLKADSNDLKNASAEVNGKWDEHEKSGLILLKKINHFALKLSKQTSKEAKVVEKLFFTLANEMKMYIVDEKIKSKDQRHFKWNYFTILGKYVEWRHYLHDKILNESTPEIDRQNLLALLNEFFETEPRQLDAKNNGVHLVQSAMRALYMSHIYFLKSKVNISMEPFERLFMDDSLEVCCAAFARINLKNMPSMMIHDVGVALLALFSDRYVNCVIKYEGAADRRIAMILNCLDGLMSNNRQESASKLIFCLFAQAIRNAHQSNKVLGKSLSRASVDFVNVVSGRLTDFASYFRSEVTDDILLIDGCHADQMWLVEKFREVRTLSIGLAKENDSKKKINKVFAKLIDRFDDVQLREYLLSLNAMKVRVESFDFDPYSDIAFMSENLKEAHYYNIISTYGCMFLLIETSIPELTTLDAQKPPELIENFRYLQRIGEVLKNDVYVKSKTEDESFLKMLEMHEQLSSAIRAFDERCLKEKAEREAEKEKIKAAKVIAASPVAESCADSSVFTSNVHVLPQLNGFSEVYAKDIYYLSNQISQLFNGCEIYFSGDYVIKEALKGYHPTSALPLVNRVQLILTINNPVVDFPRLASLLPWFTYKDELIGKLCGQFGAFHFEIVLCHPAITIATFAYMSAFSLGALTMSPCGIFDFTLRGFSDVANRKLSLLQWPLYYASNLSTLFEFFRVAVLFNLEVDPATMNVIKDHVNYLKNKEYSMGIDGWQNFLQGNAVMMLGRWLEADLFKLMLPKVAETWVGNETAYRQYCLQLDQSQSLQTIDVICGFLKIAYAPLIHSSSQGLLTKAHLILSELNKTPLPPEVKSHCYHVLREELLKKTEADRMSASVATLFAQTGRRPVGMLLGGGVPVPTPR